MKRWIPTREQLRNSRMLGPVAHRLDDEHLWHIDRDSVARAVGIGLFFGLLIPVAQILFAIALAIVLRAHVAIAAACTLITNPFTFAPIYWFAHQLGSVLLGRRGDDAAAEAAGAQAGDLHTDLGWLAWLGGLWQSIQAAGAPLLLGLAVLAVAGGVLGYALVWLFWRPRTPH